MEEFDEKIETNKKKFSLQFFTVWTDEMLFNELKFSVLEQIIALCQQMMRISCFLHRLKLLFFTLSEIISVKTSKLSDWLSRMHGWYSEIDLEFFFCEEP